MDNLTEKDLERLLQIKKREKRKIKFSKFIVTLVILLNVIFAIAVFYVFAKVGSEPSTLIGAWFGFTTVELWSLSKIKREER